MVFSSGRALGCLSTGTDACYEKLGIRDSGDSFSLDAIQQVHNVVFADVDFDSFRMAPWDAGGMHGDRCQLHEAIRTMMLQRTRSEYDNEYG